MKHSITFLFCSFFSAYAMIASNQIKVEVSYGELIDKITILQIKAEKINDQTKLENIKNELALLENSLLFLDNEIQELPVLAKQLKEINEKLWDIEDAIRDKERLKEFDQSFIELARAVYRTNDMRYAIKKKINELLGSVIQEEKSYTNY